MLTDKEKDALERIVKFEDALPSNAFDHDANGEYQLGWSWRDVNVHPSILNNLLIKGCLKTKYKSNNYTGYCLTNGGRTLLLTQE
ncbi:unnamed protein product, partial [marine sediment metagenome]